MAETKEDQPPDRAMLFVDGSNWFHAMRENGVSHTIRLDYAKISEKLVGPREWVETRYYGAALRGGTDSKLYADNRRFLSLVEKDDDRISVHLGRVEPRPAKNPLADELVAFLGANDSLDPKARGQLKSLAHRYQNSISYVEKGVDVRMAVDMFRLAMEDAYDHAYLLSADGDFVPAVEMVVGAGKTVYAACPNFGSALNHACKSFIKMPGEWFDDCYR